MVAFGRATDLYHVKADWPHQDTHGRLKISLGIVFASSKALADAEQGLDHLPSSSALNFLTVVL